jgi:tRNA1(Val) A37 N6-methylase TrmN6
VIIQGRTASKSPLALMPGLLLHQADGGFTPTAERILRDGAGLF